MGKSKSCVSTKSKMLARKIQCFYPLAFRSPIITTTPDDLLTAAKLEIKQDPS